VYLRLRSCIILNAIQCHDFVCNSEVSLRTGLAPVSDWITRGHNAIFGHVARLSDNTPAHHAMLRQVELSVGRPPDPSWKCPPGRPRTKWTDQVHQDNNSVPIATVEASYWSWSLESDATVRADYALTTATTIILIYSYCEELRNQNETLRNAYTTAACCIQVQMVACLCGCRFVDELGCVFVHKQ